MLRDLKTDNYPNDETPFFVLVGGSHCPKCLKAKKAIDSLWQKGDLVGSRTFYVDGHRDRHILRRLHVTAIPSLVRVSVQKNGSWDISKPTTDIGSQKKIMAYIKGDGEEDTSKDDSN